MTTSPQTLYTTLCLAQKINVSVVGIHRRTVITLDLDLYERAVKIRGNTGHRNSWVLRMGELHIMFALLWSLGRYIEGSGLDDIWIEKGLYRPAVIRQVFGGKHLKHGVEAHMVNLLALSGSYYDGLAKENPQMENLITSLPERLCKAVQEQDLPNIVPEIEEMTNAVRGSTVFDVLESSDEKLKDNTKFLRSYMKQIENLLKFIRASREPNFLLHLSSLHTNVRYFFAHDLYKYARLTPYYLADVADLKLKDPETWSAVKTGEIFSVFKSDIPFFGSAVDQGLKQEIRNLKIAGGVVGITQNESALSHYFLIAPELTCIKDSFWNEYGANTKVAKEHYQLKGDTAKRIYTRSKTMKEGIAKHIGNPFSATSNSKF